MASSDEEESDGFSVDLSDSDSAAPHSIVDRSLIPSSLNAEEMDFVKAASREYLHEPYPREEQPEVHLLLKSAFGMAPMSDLGALQCMPVEILSAIILQLDLTSCLRMRHVNRSARQIVTSLPMYHLVVANASSFLKHVLQLGLGSWYTLGDVESLLRQEKCLRCDNFATRIGLPLWQKLCSRHAFYAYKNVLSKTRAASILRMSTKRLGRCLPVTKKGSIGRGYTGSLVSKIEVRKLSTRMKLSRPINDVRELLKTAPQFYPSFHRLRFVDSRNGWTTSKVTCRGLTDGDFKAFRSPYHFSPREFHVHASSCPDAQKLKGILEKAADATEVEEGWIWIEGTGDEGRTEVT